MDRPVDRRARDWRHEDAATSIRIVRDPETGDLIEGTGGVRKIRVALAGTGKRGGARVIYLLPQ